MRTHLLLWTVGVLLTASTASRAGLNQDSFKVGDALTAAVCIAKDGARLAVTHEITRSGGAASVSVGGC